MNEPFAFNILYCLNSLYSDLTLFSIRSKRHDLSKKCTQGGRGRLGRY